MYLYLYYEATKTDQKFRDHKRYSAIDSACKKTKAIAHLKLMLKQLSIAKSDEIDNKIGMRTSWKGKKLLYPLYNNGSRVATEV